MTGAGPPSELRPIQLTNRYIAYYHYAVPFERDVVERAWERCVDRSCEAGRRRAEANLGPLGVDLPAPGAAGAAPQPR